MKKAFLSLFSLAVLFAACQSKPANAEQSPEPSATAAPQTVDYSINTPNFKVKDKRQYNATFLSEFQEHASNHGAKVEIDGNTVIFNGEKIEIAPFADFNKTYLLTGKQGSINVELSVKPINFSEIEYTMTLEENGKRHTSSGQARTPSTFFMGAETMENPADGVSILAQNFAIDPSDDCYGEILLTKEEKSQKLVGKVIKNCNGKLSELDENNSPFLSE